MMRAIRRSRVFRVPVIGCRSFCLRQRQWSVCLRRLFQFCLPASMVGNEPPVSRATFRGEAKVLPKFIAVGMYAVRRSFAVCERASSSRVSSFAEGRTQMKSGSHASTRMNVRPYTKPERRTRRQSQRPGLSRLVLRAARVAPAPVVAHL
jgi:hypothetical protein